MKKIILGLFWGYISFSLGACADKSNLQSVQSYLNAMEEYSNGNFKEAASILDNEKSLPSAITLRAKAQYFMNDLDSAEQSCKQAIRLRPTSFEAKLYLARIMKEKGDADSVKKLIESLMADNPHDIQLLRFTANNALDQGNVSDAFALLNQAAELSSESAMVMLDRARLYWVSGKGKEALEDLSRARAILPQNSPFAMSINNLEKRITEAIQ